MKKEPLSIIIVKTLLAVIVFTGIGTIIIGGAYLIGKQSIIPPPHYQPSGMSECKVDSDCRLVAVSGACTPCSTSDEEYQCLPKEEAIEIIEERQRILNDPEGPLCSLCMPPFEVQHTCECENGKCEKVKIEQAEEISITTGKMEYEQGENAKITVNNNLDESVFCEADCNTGLQPFVILERYEKNKWIKHKRWEPYPDPPFHRCDTPGYICVEIKNTKKISLFLKSYNPELPLPIGKYRIGLTFGKSCDSKRIYSYYDLLKDKLVVYSNEFTIKEKSALDPRCGEKVKGIGSCKRSAIGYEFDSNLEKCVEKRVGGCSFEIPFGSLEECQEVCEKKENVTLPSNNELIKCSDDSDCVLVNNDWCDCSMGGRMTCINKKYLEDWNQKLKLDHKDSINCPAIYLCDYNFTGCECVNNACQGIGGDFLDMVNEELLKSNQ